MNPDGGAHLENMTRQQHRPLHTLSFISLFSYAPNTTHPLQHLQVLSSLWDVPSTPPSLQSSALTSAPTGVEAFVLEQVWATWCCDKPSDCQPALLSGAAGSQVSWWGLGLRWRLRMTLNLQGHCVYLAIWCLFWMIWLLILSSVGAFFQLSIFVKKLYFPHNNNHNLGVKCHKDVFLHCEPQL